MYSAATCGFCHSTSNATSWCWAAAGEGGDPLDHTCDADAGFAWVVGACPSPYSWIAITALLLYLASFAPGQRKCSPAQQAQLHTDRIHSVGNASVILDGLIFPFFLQDWGQYRGP